MSCALRVVRDAGYTGTISIEYEGNSGDAWENTRRTRALVKDASGLYAQRAPVALPATQRVPSLARPQTPCN